MKKLICLLILLLVIPVSAQFDNPASAAFQALEVSNVRLRLSDDGSIAVIFNATPAVCEDLLVDVDVAENYITISANAPRTDAVCNTFAPYEPVIDLPQLETGQAYILYLNDFTSTFFLTDMDEESSVEPFAVLWGQENLLIDFNHVSPFIDAIELSPSDSGINATLRGNHPDGCVVEEYARVYQDNVQTTLYHVDAFRLLPTNVICPAELVPFETSIELDVQDGDLLEIDEHYFLIEDGEAISVNRVALIVKSVDIVSAASDIVVVVEGTQDCGFEVSTNIGERTFISVVDIAAYVPADDPCTDVRTEYEESFIVENLPVVINGSAYDERGEIIPPFSAQSDTNAAEGNEMPVDTVIEDVEVAILESFPMQLQLTVSGYQPDGCDFPVEVVQSVEGNDVTLHIYRNVPIDVLCPMMLTPYTDTITVEGTFEGGTVNIQVNEFTTSVDL